MLKCKDIAHQASDYLDDQLPWYRKLPWLVHLSMCRNCRRFVQHLQLTVLATKPIGRPQSKPEDVDEIVEKAIKNGDRGNP